MRSFRANMVPMQLEVEMPNGFGGDAEEQDSASLADRRRGAAVTINGGWYRYSLEPLRKAGGETPPVLRGGPSE